jgi:integrase
MGVVRLEVGTTKNREGRTFPFSVLPELEAMLREQRERTRVHERAHGQIVRWVFHRRGDPIHRVAFRRAWHRACPKVGVRGRVPHDLRRTAVRNLERAGVSRSVAMKLTGHKTESVYRRYAIVAERDLAEGVQKLASFRQADRRRAAEGARTRGPRGSTKSS